MAKVGSGVVLAQLIGLFAYPILSRIYAPEDFGLYTFFTSSVIVGSIFVTGAYEFAIPLSKDKEKAVSLYRFCLTLSSLLSLLLLFFAILGLTLFNDAIRINSYLLLIIPLGVLLHSYTTIKTQVYIFLKSFKELSISKISQTSALAITQILAGLTGFGPIGLISGHLVGRTAFLFKNIKKHISLLKFSRLSFKQNLKSTLDHPKFVMPSLLIDAVSKELPVFLILPFFGQEVLGLYAFAFRVLIAPVLLVSMSINSVFFQRISESFNHGKKISSFLIKVWGILFGIGILPFLLVFLFGPDIFKILFGAEWAESGEYASILTFMIFARFIFFPTSKTLLVLKKKKWLPVFSILSLILTLFSLTIGYYFKGFVFALLLLSVGQGLLYILQILFTLFSAKKYESEMP